MNSPHLTRLAAGLLLSLSLSACVVTPAPYGEVVTYQAPPPLPYEVVGVAPAPGYFWIGGAWFWEGGRYNWHPGRWEASRAGYRWQPHTWHQRGHEWHLAPGHWEPRR
jgi:YXWGXW repeat-containing protein